MFYEAGRQQALAELGLVKEAKVAPLLLRQRKSPFAEIQRRITRAFKIKMPKFDMTALLARLLRNPFRQPQLHLSGKTPPLKA